MKYTFSNAKNDLSRIGKIDVTQSVNICGNVKDFVELTKITVDHPIIYENPQLAQVFKLQINHFAYP